jgi:anti-sigma B factor antagonist
MIDVNVKGVKDDSVRLVEISGRIDSMNANQFAEALNGEIDSGNMNLILDLTSVDYMSSAGLREIVGALKKVRRGAGDLRIAQPSERVLEVLEMAGLDTILQIYATQDEALDSY